MFVPSAARRYNRDPTALRTDPGSVESCVRTPATTSCDRWLQASTGPGRAIGSRSALVLQHITGSTCCVRLCAGAFWVSVFSLHTAKSLVELQHIIGTGCGGRRVGRVADTHARQPRPNNRRDTRRAAPGRGKRSPAGSARDDCLPSNAIVRRRLLGRLPLGDSASQQPPDGVRPGRALSRKRVLHLSAVACGPRYRVALRHGRSTGSPSREVGRMRLSGGGGRRFRCPEPGSATSER